MIVLFDTFGIKQINNDKRDYTIHIGLVKLSVLKEINVYSGCTDTMPNTQQSRKPTLSACVMTYIPKDSALHITYQVMSDDICTCCISCIRKIQ